MGRPSKPKVSAKDREWFVYFLRDPRDMRVRYIGASSEPAKRFNNHLHFSFEVPNSRWIRELAEIGLTPIQHIVLGPVNHEQAIRAESRLIRLHSVRRPGELFQRVFKPKSPAMSRLFGTVDVAESTPFVRAVSLA